MSFGRQEEIQQTIVPSSSFSLRSNNNKTYDNKPLQSTNMSSNNETKKNKEDFSLLIRVKVRLYLFIYLF